jgi:hypothetical protein
MEAEEYAKCLEDLAANRRTAPRFALEGDASILLVDHGSSISCKILDLSVGGCQLRTSDRFPAGVRVLVEVSFKVHGIVLRFRGTVQWKAGESLFGIRFAEMTSRRRDELAEVLREVEAENAAKTERLAAEKQAAQSPATEYDWDDDE